MAGSDPERFFGFNDVYFMGRIQELYWSKVIKDPIVNEQMKMLIYRVAPKTVVLPESEHRLIEIDGGGKASRKDQAIKKLENKLAEIQSVFKKHGKGTEWIIADNPSRDIIFTKDIQTIIRKRESDNLYSERDPIKLVDKSGNPSLLVERENSLIARIAKYVNFIPNVYANDAAVELMRSRKIIPY
jgi:hypothetical protein